jgi:arylsulfatase
VSGIGRGGTGVLKVDGKEVAQQTIEHTMPLTMQWDENFDIGADTGTPDPTITKCRSSSAAHSAS